MPIYTSICAECGILRILVTGMINLEDRIKFIDRMLKLDDLPSACSVLVDVNKVSNHLEIRYLEITADFIDRIHARFKKKIAILNVTAGHVALSHLLVLSTLDGGKRIRVFCDQDEAICWLKTTEEFL